MNTGTFKYLLIFCTSVAFAQPESDTDDVSPQDLESITPDLRGEEVPLKVEKGSFVAVPIPVSNPTLGNMLVVGAAYFYAQTEEQKETQPASVTAGGIMYSSNDSYGAAIGQENY